jgi:hypothetical protein
LNLPKFVQKLIYLLLSSILNPGYSGIYSNGNPVLEVSEVLERCHGDVSFRHCSLLKYFNLRISNIPKYAYKKLR